ncbi:ribonuclease HI family protein [bacterium]|nr:ribonuclease HI family protein [bacterium]
MEKIILYTDGGSRGNPGPAGAGVLICNSQNQVIKRYAHYLGDSLTNNQAEYMAVIFGLKKLKSLFGKKKTRNLEVEVRTDSEFLTKQLNGEYKILDKKIQPLFLEVWNLKFDFGKVKFLCIPRKKNKEADRLVNESLNKRNTTQRLL